MITRLRRSNDPFEGRAARRTHLRLRIEGAIALVLAIVACGLAAALWLRTLAPFASQFGLG
jgi:fructose-1,6-bisphosphatase/inositol monophosphatase family enzyme